MKITGHYKDTLIHATGEHTEFKTQHNQIQSGCGILLAGLAAGHNFGPGVGAGLGHIAYGSGLDEWFLPSSEPAYGDIGLYGDEGQWTVTGENALPQSTSVGLGAYFILHVGSTAYELLVRVPDELAGAPAIPADPSVPGIVTAILLGDQAAELGAYFSMLLTDDNRIQLVLGENTSIDIRSPIGRTTDDGEITSDLFSVLGFPHQLLTSGSSAPSDPVRDQAATTLAAEFARQAVPTSSWAFVTPEDGTDPATWVASSVATNALRFTVVRGRTAADEEHGEFGLYGAYDAQTGTGQFFNWAVRPQRITKRAADMLETIIVIEFTVA